MITTIIIIITFYTIIIILYTLLSTEPNVFLLQKLYRNKLFRNS